MAQPAPAPVQTSAPKAAALDEATITREIVKMVAEKTGYPEDMLDLDLDMEADLGIDTVKQAELFAAMREHYGITAQQEGIQLKDYPTIRHCIKYVLTNAGGAPVQTPTVTPVQVAPVQTPAPAPVTPAVTPAVTPVVAPAPVAQPAPAATPAVASAPKAVALTAEDAGRIFAKRSIPPSMSHTSAVSPKAVSSSAVITALVIG